MLADTGFQLPLDPVSLNWRPDQAYLDDLQAKVRAMIKETE